MRKIRVTLGGCGVTITDANGAARYMLKTPKDEPFECDDALAARFVGQGVAVYCDCEENATQPNVEGETADETEGAEPSAAHLSAEELKTWDYNDLKKLAADMGVTPKGKKKADYITALVAADLEIDDEDEELPELGVADPE